MVAEPAVEVNARPHVSCITPQAEAVIPICDLAEAVGWRLPVGADRPAGAGQGRPQRPSGPNAEGHPSPPERRAWVTAGDVEQGGVMAEAAPLP